MPTYAKHNLNWKIKYRLTETGREIRNAYYRDIGMEPPELVTDEDGYCTNQAWSVWQKYGPAMHLGGDPPFETDVLIEVETEAA